MNNSISSLALNQLYGDLSSSQQGLSAATAQSKLIEQQKNRKTESRFTRELKLLIRQFTNPLILLLVVAVILSAVMGDNSDSIIILFILIATGLLSFFQELNAGRAVEKLQQLIELKQIVLRDGKPIEIPQKEVVSGDVVILKAGDVIPADCRIIESNELHINESTLTGESFPVEKMPGEVDDNAQLIKKINCLWQGTNVVSGTANALAVNTGNETIFGQMAHSLQQTPETAFERGIKQFGFFLLRITVVLSFVILVANIYFGKPLFDAVLFSLALAVGMAPELLPAIMTFAMSAGAKRMLEKKVIVKRLSSIFNFSEVNVLCTDKTGTITEGGVSIKDILNADGNTDDEVKLYTYLNASFQGGFQNPVDDVIKTMKCDAAGYEKLSEVPYDFIRKRLSIEVKHTSGNLVISKGALSNILDVCSVAKIQGQEQTLDPALRHKIETQYTLYCEGGLRVLGISVKKTDKDKITREDEQGMTFLGFILLEDPLKENALESIKRLEQLNVKIKIITGDNRYAAEYIAKKIGITNPKIITGDMLHTMTPEALTVNAMNADIFAEIEPQQKEGIVKSLQKSKLVVAYMGDGINDVAAIHAADTGISTNNAVDVAKEAADFVLLEKDLNVLADGILEGRKSFVNSMKYIYINTGATFGNIFSVAGASLLLPFLPMLPKQILLTNFITDFPYLSIASDNVDEEELKTPRKWDLKIIQKFMIVFGLHSSLFDFITFFALYSYLKVPQSAFQTGWFIESVLTELLILFIIRTKKPFFKSKPAKILLVMNLLAFAINVWLPFSPFASMLGLTIANWQEMMAIAIILVAYIITADLLKVLFFKFQPDSSK